MCSGGFSIFWCDDGLDTGPILLQKSVDLDPNETIDSLYTRFLYPEGITGVVEAVNLIDQGKAPKITQPEEGASYEPMLNKKELTRLNLAQMTGREIHNFIRGCDKVPGAWISLDGQAVKLYGSKMYRFPIPDNRTEISIDGKTVEIIYIDSDFIGLQMSTQKQYFTPMDWF